MYGGAADVFEFAGKEYGLSKSTVSRFIAINEKFSEGGNSLELKAEYREIGSSKLAEMLTLTDAECSLITEKTTVSQIRELKNFNRQELEEGEGPDGVGRQEGAYTPLQKCIIEYFRGKKEMLDEAMECIAGNDNKGASEIINPNGNTSFKKGLIFLFMYEYKDGIKYETFGSREITAMSWDDFILEICDIFRQDYSMGANGYDAFYGTPEEEPEKVEKTPERRNGEGAVATSQRKEKEDEDHVEKMEDEKDPESGDEEDNEPSGQSEDEGESGNDEDGAGGDGGEVDPDDAVYMGECSLKDIVMGMDKPTKEMNVILFLHFRHIIHFQIL